MKSIKKKEPIPQGDYMHTATPADTAGDDNYREGNLFDLAALDEALKISNLEQMDPLVPAGEKTKPEKAEQSELTPAAEKKKKTASLDLTSFTLSSPPLHAYKKTLSMSSLHRDSNFQRPLQAKARSKTLPGDSSPPLFTLMYDATTSSANNPVAEKVYQREKEKYNESTFLSLVKHHENDTYHLQSNHSHSPIVPDGTYAYVIMPNNDGMLELRLGKKNHFYVAEKSRHKVVAAGDIHFTKLTPTSATSDLDWITDFSGGYHIEENDAEFLAPKRESIKHAIVKVGLPLDKFHFFKPKHDTPSGRRTPP